MIGEYGVYVPGAAPPDARTTGAVAAATGLSAVDARLILTAPFPKKVAAEDSAEGAAARVRALREAGLEAFVVTNDALRGARAPRLSGFRLDGGRVIFEPGADDFRPRLVVRGLIRKSVRVDQKRVVHVQGVPRLERVRGTPTTGAEPFLRLYGESYADAFEIRPSSFNFRALGGRFQSTTAGNVSALLELLGDVRVDDTLTRASLPPETEGQEVVRESDEEAAMRTATLIAVDLLRR